MKKLVLAFISLLCPLAIQSRTTYIPTYRSFISIMTVAGDTLNKEEYGGVSLSVMTEKFCISVVHEEMTKEKVRAIKRKKAAAGWMAASTILSSVSALSSGSLIGFEARTANARLSGLMTKMYANNAKAEQILKVQIQFQNLSPNEIMVADTERGLVWYVRSGGCFVTELENPDVAQLRISEVGSTTESPLYVTACGGSTIQKEEIFFENDEIWIATSADDDLYKYQLPKEREYYLISKDDFSQQPISYEDFKRIKKQN